MYTFDDITGNEFIINGLQKSIKEGKTAHAYIFDGKPGSGKKLISNTFAKTLQCVKGGIKPCGECVSCRAFDDSNHPDVMFITSDTKSIGVDLVREKINSLVRIKPYKYRYKIFIVDKAHTMTAQAQNALLKNIEEPPEYVKFFLLTDNASALLPTILSRCILYKILPLKPGQVYNYLITKGYDPSLSSTLSALCEGSIGKASSLLEDDTYIQLRNDVLGIIRGFDKQSVPDILLLTKELEKYKDKP
ncbi:MAG: DNA polymerase III subunit, partial [Clostridiales bacterium]|nr:DNA polymerase III subunit [Clostridiales bacterium]